jgi:hypothetical protein
MSTTTRCKVFANLYKDSVSLMQLTAQLREREGVAQASCVMATPTNLAQLRTPTSRSTSSRRRRTCSSSSRRAGGVRRSDRRRRGVAAVQALGGR